MGREEVAAEAVGLTMVIFIPGKRYDAAVRWKFMAMANEER